MPSKASRKAKRERRRQQFIQKGMQQFLTVAISDNSEDSTDSTTPASSNDSFVVFTDAESDALALTTEPQVPEEGLFASALRGRGILSLAGEDADRSIEWDNCGTSLIASERRSTKRKKVVLSSDEECIDTNTPSKKQATEGLCVQDISLTSTPHSARGPCSSKDAPVTARAKTSLREQLFAQKSENNAAGDSRDPSIRVVGVVTVIKVRRSSSAFVMHCLCNFQPHRQLALVNILHKAPKLPLQLKLASLGFPIFPAG